MYGYMPMYYFDPTYILILIGVLLSMGASAKLNATYGRYSSVASRCGMTGAQAAQRILQSQGIYDVTVRHVSGRLTDHYDPRSKTVNLSDAVYGSTSIAAIGVAAHECGHAIQDARDYAPLRLRAALVPVANFGSQISWLLIILGIVLGGTGLINLGILMFSLAVLFQLVVVGHFDKPFIGQLAHYIVLIQSGNDTVKLCNELISFCQRITLTRKFCVTISHTDVCCFLHKLGFVLTHILYGFAQIL